MKGVQLFAENLIDFIFFQMSKKGSITKTPKSACSQVSGNGTQ